MIAKPALYINAFVLLLSGLDCLAQDSEKNILFLKAQYSIYQLDDLRNFQDSFLDDFPVEAGNTDEFPATIEYSGGYIRAIQKIRVGVEFGYLSTGARTNTTDLSGFFNVDHILTRIRYGLLLGFDILNKDRLKLVPSINLSYSNTNYTIESEFNLNTINNPQAESVELTSEGFVIEPNINLEYNLRSLLFTLGIGYEIYSPSEITLKQNSDAFLIDDNGNEIELNWSGFRAGIGVGFKF